MDLPTVFKYKLSLVEVYYWNGNWSFHHNVEFYYGDFVSAVSQNELLQDVYLVPNPATTYVKVLHTGDLHQASISIFDMTSKPVYQGNVNAYINVSKFPKGIYFYRIKSREGIKTGKLLIK